MITTHANSCVTLCPSSVSGVSNHLQEICRGKKVVSCSYWYFDLLEMQETVPRRCTTYDTWRNFVHFLAILCTSHFLHFLLCTARNACSKSARNETLCSGRHKNVKVEDACAFIHWFVCLGVKKSINIWQFFSMNILSY